MAYTFLVSLPSISITAFLYNQRDPYIMQITTGFSSNIRRTYEPEECAGKKEIEMSGCGILCGRPAYDHLSQDVRNCNNRLYPFQHLSS